MHSFLIMISRRKFIGIAAASIGAAIGYGLLKINAVNWDEIKGVEEVMKKTSSDPDIILIPQAHPHPYREAVSADKEETTAAIEDICLELYDKYEVRNIISEGISEKAAAIYNYRGSIGVPRIKEGPVKEYWKDIATILNSREWNVISGEDQNLSRKLDAVEQPIQEVHEDYINNVRQSVVARMNEIYERKPDGSYYMDPDKQHLIQSAIDEAIKKFYPEADQMIHKMVGERIDDLYELTITSRNSSYIRAAKEQEGKTIIIYGRNHTDSFVRQMSKENLDFVVLKPEGFNGNATFEITKDMLKERYMLYPGGDSLLHFEVKVTDKGLVYEE